MQKRVYFAERQLYKGADYHTAVSMQLRRKITPNQLLDSQRPSFATPMIPKKAPGTLGYYTCPKCAMGVGINNKACPHCGEAAPETVLAQQDKKPSGPKFCGGCGKEAPQPSPNFCAGCGTKLK
eukprot:TRINITY_DN3464_c0_g1_i2.p1 TRINITY_DN3464_c0_g1~~TRINITY_DN3464_c0_g1_i2.p1  ORF type:complete len:124 (+),score=42.85 TRINITY_DN3464_c0_g1_i2:141-512(+)